MTRIIATQVHEFNGIKMVAQVREIPGGACQHRVVGVSVFENHVKPFGDYVFKGSKNTVELACKDMILEMIKLELF